MAIIESAPGIVVTVKSNGAALQEYVDDNDPLPGPLRHKTVMKYIESSTDSFFSICWHIPTTYKMDCAALSFRVFVDGKYANSRVIQHIHLRTHSDIEIQGTESNHSDNVGHIMKFKFAQVNISMCICHGVLLFTEC